jgi:hypothetical protein
MPVKEALLSGSDGRETAQDKYPGIFIENRFYRMFDHGTILSGDWSDFCLYV